MWEFIPFKLENVIYISKEISNFCVENTRHIKIDDCVFRLEF